MLKICQTEAHATGVCRYVEKPIQVLYCSTITTLILVGVATIQRGEMSGKMTDCPASPGIRLRRWSLQEAEETF